MPSAAEREEHERLHEPYRAWCAACIAGRGRADRHVGRSDDEKGLPVVGIDYGYLWRRAPEDNTWDVDDEENARDADEETKEEKDAAGSEVDDDGETGDGKQETEAKADQHDKQLYATNVLARTIQEVRKQEGANVEEKDEAE